MRYLKIVPLLVVLALSLSLTACKSDCEKFYDLMVECDDGDNAPDKDKFLKECAKEADSDEGKAMLGCATSSSECKDFEACMEKVMEERSKAMEEEWAKEDIEKIKAAIEKGDWTDRPSSCYGMDEPDTNEGSRPRDTSP